jgi:DNA-binding XRE family transcriptional regulator
MDCIAFPNYVQEHFYKYVYKGVIFITGKKLILNYSKYEDLKKSSGLTDKDVSEKTGIARSTLSEWKSGRSEPKIEILMKLSGLFCTPVMDFVKKEYRVDFEKGAR